MASAFWGVVKMVNPKTGQPAMVIVGPCQTEAEWFKEAQSDTGQTLGPWRLNTQDKTLATQALRLKLKDGHGVKLEDTVFNRFRHQTVAPGSSNSGYRPVEPQPNQALRDLQL